MSPTPFSSTGVCTNTILKTRKACPSRTKTVRADKNKTCPKCRKVVTSGHFQAHLKTHLAENERVKFKCPVNHCAKECINKQNLKYHFAAVHSITPRVKLKCDHCSKDYFTKPGLKLHVQQIHYGATSKYECNLCDAVFATTAGRNYHIVSAHTAEKAFQCKECPSKFACDSSLRAHQIVHTDDKPNKCKLCSKRFKRRGDLRSHLNGVHSQTTTIFRCSICQKTVSNSRTLSRHSRIHNQEVRVRQHPCYFCPKAFFTKGEQMSHLSIHTQEKPFICSDASCTYSTNNAAGLKTHIKRRHTSDSDQIPPSRIWTCYFCFKTGWTRACHLEPHIRNHTLELPFSCALCKKSFTDNRNLQQHIFTHTKKTLPLSPLPKMFPF